MSHSSERSSPLDSAAPIHGMVAEFNTVDELIHASTQVRDAGFEHWDAHTPFPVHGLDAAMGIRPTRLPWLVLLSGLTGLSCALLLQWWTNAYDYPFHISGKPLFSLPANIPVCFELTVLFSAFAVFFGSLTLNKLPALFDPVCLSQRLRRATADKFFIYIQARDPLFQQINVAELFNKIGAHQVETIYFDTHSPQTRFPKWLKGAVAIVVVLSLVPLALIARARQTTSPLPRIHILPDDMDSQYKFKAQSANWFFDDGRAMRQPPYGTVAVENVVADTPFYTGKHEGVWVTEFPPEITLNDTLMQRGHERFNVYCSVCHGLSGYGDGLVARHAEALMEGTWVAPSSLHDERVRNLAAGDIFNTISHGVRNMPAYGSQIEVADRWAIVLYVRALQLSQHAPKSLVPADVLPTLQ